MTKKPRKIIQTKSTSVQGKTQMMPRSKNSLERMLARLIASISSSRPFAATRKTRSHAPSPASNALRSIRLVCLARLGDRLQEALRQLAVFIHLCIERHHVGDEFRGIDLGEGHALGLHALDGLVRCLQRVGCRLGG